MLQRSDLIIDFEGEQNGPPVLLGVLGRSPLLGDDGEFRQFVFDETLQRAGAVSSTRHGPCVALPILDALQRIRAAVEGEDSMVYAWSTYDESAILSLVAEDDDVKFWTGRVVDAKAVAKRWKRRYHPSVEFPRTPGSGRHALRHYLDLIGYPIPTTQRGGKTGQRIRAVRSAVQRRGSFDALTAVEKRKWRSLIEHNWHDCNGLRVLLEECSMN